MDALKRYFVLPSGEVICGKCFDQGYVTCEHCGDIVPKGKCEFSDGNWYCERCVDNFYIHCENCGDLVLEDDAYNDNDYWYCSSCHEEREEENENEDDKSAWRDHAEHFLASMREYKEADVLKAFPGIKERLSRIFDRSAMNRSIDARRALKSLKALLPSVHFNDDFTYVNPINATKSMRDLISPKNSTYKALSTTDQRNLIYHVSAIDNVRRDIGQLMNEKETATIDMIDAVKCRMYIDKHYKDYSRAVHSIEGTYPYPDKKNKDLLFIITQDPVAIIAKSTSQCWESMSCEKVIRGEYGYGAFTDIAESNAVCYIFEKNLPIARIMIRRCVAGNGEFDFGIEKKWYYCLHRPKNADTFDSMGISTLKGSSTTFIGDIRAEEATKFLVSILKSKGFYSDYSSCNTPYWYIGFSDTAGMGRTKIKYKRDE